MTFSLFLYSRLLIIVFLFVLKLFYFFLLLLPNAVINLVILIILFKFLNCYIHAILNSLESSFSYFLSHRSCLCHPKCGRPCVSSSISSSSLGVSSFPVYSKKDPEYITSELFLIDFSCRIWFQYFFLFFWDYTFLIFLSSTPTSYSPFFLLLGICSFLFAKRFFFS